MKNWKQKRRIALFLIVFLTAYLIAEAGMLFIHFRNTAVYTREYEVSCQKIADTMADLFGNSLYSSVQNANSVFSQTWYSHLRNYVGFYENEFDSATQFQIKDSVLHMVSAMQYTQDLIIIIPETRVIISRNGWHSPETYNRVFGDVQVDIASDASRNVTVSGNTAYILVEDSNIRKYAGYAVVVLNAKKLMRQFLALMDENVLYAMVTVGDSVVFENGICTDSLLVKSARFKYPEMTVTIGYTQADMSAEHRSFCLLSSVLLLGFAVIGMLLYNHMMKPVHALVRKSGGGKKEMQAPFDYITSYIDRLNQVQAQLTNENRARIDEMNMLSEQARTAMLYGMLTMRSFRLDPANAILVFPWLYTVHDMCLFGISGKEQDISPISGIRVLDGMNYAVQTSTNAGCFALVWLSNDMTATEKQEYACMLRREWGRRNDALCFCSCVFSDFEKVGEMGSTLEKTMTEGLRIGSALPEEERLRLAGHIHANNKEEADALIHQLRINYDAQDVFGALCAMADENPTGEQATWESVQNRLQALLVRESNEAEHSPSDEAKRYLEYIDANLCDPDMSIIKLSDIYGRHRTLISKEIKQCTGETFTDYLRTRRIQLAMKRMLETDENIMQIANEVGYVSYSTFKRAFKQLTGKTPIEFRGSTEDENQDDM